MHEQDANLPIEDDLSLVPPVPVEALEALTEPLEHFEPATLPLDHVEAPAPTPQIQIGEHG